MATTGQLLKKRLGLEELKNVRVVRFVVSSYKILGIFYDSNRDFLVTNYRIKSYPRVATIFNGTDLFHGTNKYTPMTPPVDIEDYNGNLRGALVIPIDLAGDRFVDEDNYSKIFESKKAIKERFVDYVKSSEDGENYSLHVNPSRQELNEIKKEDEEGEIRGIYLANTDETYVANASLLHRNIRRYLERINRDPLYLNDFAVYFLANDSRNVHMVYTSMEAVEAFQNTIFYKKFLDGYRASLEKQILEKRLELFIPKNTLNEITLYDLADAGNISNFTQTWRKDRNRTMGTENTTAKLIDCVINEADNSVMFQFLTEATELGNKNPNDNIDSSYRFYDGPKGEVDPDNLRIKRNRSRTYEIQIRIIDALEWVKAFEGEKIGQKEMKEILEVSDVQIFSTSPSFQMQGFNFWNTQIDASIYPENRKPQRWDAFHGDGQAFLDKHLYGLMRQIKFFINPMASMLNSKLRNRGLI